MLRACFWTSALLLTLWGCGSDDETGIAEPRGGSSNAGHGGSQTDASGSTNGGSAHPIGGAASGGEPSAAGTTSESGKGGTADDEGGAGGDGGAQIAGGAGAGGESGVVTVPATIDKSVTKQLSPLDLNQPFIIEIGTRSFYPVTLVNPAVVVPDGWVLSHVEEMAGNCPYLVRGKQRCLQLWQAHLYPKASVCQLVKDPLEWSWDVTCAPGADCRTMPPELTGPVTVTTTHSSEYFCEAGSIDAAPFLPQSAALLPTLGTKPFTLRLFTTLNLPYTFSAGDVTLPDGFSLVSFSEDVTKSACDTQAFPNACRKWWNLVVNPGEVGNASGSYGISWDVGCVDGGDCDPALETYSNELKLVDSRNLCAP